MSVVILYLMTISACVFHLAASDCVENGTSCDKFECEYNVLLKLSKLEAKLAQQDEKIAEQNEKIAEQNEKHIQQEKMIESLTHDLEESRRMHELHSSDGSTYVRWGRTTCPNRSTVVYEGYAAGSHFTNTGAAANAICLTTKPVWGQFTSNLETVDGAYVFGAEYETSIYSAWSHLHEHDVPCVVCRALHNDILMVPGSNICPNKYDLEYNGYLMAGNHKYAAASEYVCMDGEAETIDGGYQDLNGYLFYFVQAYCGSLKCPPYKHGREVTCAVCSFSTKSQSQSVQPYA